MHILFKMLNLRFGLTKSGVHRFKMLSGSKSSLTTFVLPLPSCVDSFAENRELEFTVTSDVLLSTGFMLFNYESKSPLSRSFVLSFTSVESLTK